MLGHVQDAAEDAVESSLQIPSMGNNGAESQEMPYFQARDEFYGQSNALHEKQPGISTHTYSQPVLPLQIGSWPRTAGAQSE